MNVFDVINSPIVTEKAEVLREQNVYVFKVSKRANKTLIKKAIKAIYGVTPLKVNVLNVLGKAKKNRFGFGYKAGYKKAYVFLDTKDKIELFEGV
ncbi:MAG: 50S ribosomal protein L23 [Leptospirales bacterium]